MRVGPRGPGVLRGAECHQELFPKWDGLMEQTRQTQVVSIAWTGDSKRGNALEWGLAS